MVSLINSFFALSIKTCSLSFAKDSMIGLFISTIVLLIASNNGPSFAAACLSVSFRR